MLISKHKDLSIKQEKEEQEEKPQIMEKILHKLRLKTKITNQLCPNLGKSDKFIYLNTVIFKYFFMEVHSDSKNVKYNLRKVFVF